MALALCIGASAHLRPFPGTPIPLRSSSSSSSSSSWFLPRRSSSVGSLASLPGPREGNSGTAREQEQRLRGDVAEEGKFGSGMATAIEESMPARDFVTIAACVVGLLTGVGVVLFNNAVHEINDFCWDGLPSRGASWLREKPLEEVWQRVVLVPACGGVIVGMLYSLQSSLQAPSEGMLSNLRGALRPFLKAIAASVTLGTGNSLGPEGPSVEIGSAIAKGVGHIFEWRGDKRLSLIASGSAAGISSGFNAAVAGCFFAVESVLWPSPADSFSSLSNSTPMVILSSVIASVISEIGLGSDPAFTVPEYDFRSPSELPLYLLLGILCGLVSVTLSVCTSFALEVVDNFQRTTGITKAIFPALGGLTVGLMALAYPEVLYWGFENVDILLESQPFVDGLPTAILFQLVGVKILATSLSRASGLVGGYYAPSLFIGAATGMAYGKFARSTLCGPNPLFHLSILDVASPQAYGLVGMAATLAGVCQVPLTSVLLLFELTRDYHIVLPLLGAVGLSSWISSSQNKKRDAADKLDDFKVKGNSQQPKDPLYKSPEINYLAVSAEASDTADLCKIESSLCLYDASAEVRNLAERMTVAQAMKTKYVTVLMRTSIVEAVTLMLVEKQSYAVIIDDSGSLVGLLELEDIQSFSRVARTRIMQNEVDRIQVSHICHLKGNNCKAWTATPDMTLLTAERIMDAHGVNHLPVVSDHINRQGRGDLVGLLDRQCISIACSAAAAKELLSS
ncbi:chloride channel protein CLC-e isoform X2 [Phoenix dactylifera]|uniref:Chloride channel protein n=1 Tax=Phoenix dactylifera TaxID=42345 RepID=A0A8B7CCV1_PHODC|nr:chloride channel protein CLC-e isoform X2 [Phoenix dactylifera]